MFYTGDLLVEQPAIDNEFGVIASQHPYLYREVEVYCWRQKTTTRTEHRGKQRRTITDYNYKACWRKAVFFPDSTNFKDKKYDLNIAPNVEPETFFSQEDALIGGVFKVSPQDVKNASALTT